MSFTITNGLCALADVKAALRITTDTDDDDRISLAIEAASRLIESGEVCNRQFTQDATVSARAFVPTDREFVEVDDFQTTEGLIVKVDYAGDGSFGTTWEAADYQLEPINGLENGRPWPYTGIRALRSLYFPAWGSTTWTHPYTQALVQVTAQWGWAAVPPEVTKAAIVQSISLFKADDVPFGATPFADTGILRLKDSLHPTAALLLRDYIEDELLIL